MNWQLLGATAVLVIVAAFCILLFVLPMGPAWAVPDVGHDLANMVPPAAVHLLELLLRFPDAPNEWIVPAAGVVGMFWHWRKKKKRRETLSTFMAYFFGIRPGRTFATVMLLWVASMFVIAALPIATAPAGGAFVVGFALGWMLDSWINIGNGATLPISSDGVK